MCGVFGWSWVNLPEKADRLVLGACLASLNDERGGDSWGYATPDGEIRKGLGFFGRNPAAREIHEHATIIGHTRFRTIGEVNIKNAHPFKHGRVVGAHNGCIYNKFDLDKKYNRNFPIDSQHIFQHIEENLWPLDDLRGYGTIEFFHSESPESVFLGRFENGELAVARVKDYGIVWSSTKSHLEASLAMAGMDGSGIELLPKIVYEIRKGKIYRTKWRIHGEKSTTRGYSSSCEWVDDDDYEAELGFWGYGMYRGRARRRHVPSSYQPESQNARLEREHEELFNVEWKGKYARFQNFYKKPFTKQLDFFKEVAERKAASAPEKQVTSKEESSTDLTDDDVKKINQIRDVMQSQRLVEINRTSNKTTYAMRDVQPTVLDEEDLLDVLKNQSLAEKIEESLTFDIHRVERGTCSYECEKEEGSIDIICEVCEGCVDCCGRAENSILFHQEIDEATKQTGAICQGCYTFSSTFCDYCGLCIDCCDCPDYQTLVQ